LELTIFSTLAGRGLKELMEDQPGGGIKREGMEQNGHMCQGKQSPDFKDNSVK